VRLIRSLLELIRFSHTVFALPFALTSAALAWSRAGFHTLQLAGILLCMVTARSAGMAFNRLADRHLDAANPRTAGRHLPSGQLSVGVVWAFTLASAAGFLLSTLLFLLLDNPWPMYLSGPVLVFICAYSFTKRFTALCHFWLGASLFLTPVAAWISILAWQDIAVPCVLGLAVLFWVAGFDILYACQDVEFDRRSRLHSIPALLGVRNSLRLALGCHLIMLLCLLGLYAITPELQGFVYLVGSLAVAVLLLIEHQLVRPDDLSRVNQAFFQVNAIISIGLFLVVVLQLVVRG
jgi:4-hydroxybenzoate polyprenyltransferase